jgi:hypothetical protein
MATKISFIFHIINRHFDFLAWQHCFYFIIASELQQSTNKNISFSGCDFFVFLVQLEFGRHFEFSCLATLILFFYQKQSIIEKN